MRRIMIVGVAVVLVAMPVLRCCGVAGAAQEQPFKIAPGPSIESLIKQRADQEAKNQPGLRDYVLAAQALQAGDLAGAIEQFNKAIQANDELWQSFQGRGIAYALSNQYGPARADFERALQLSPSTPAPRVFLNVIKQIQAGPSGRDIYSPKATDPFGYEISQWAIDLTFGQRPEEAKELAAKIAREFGYGLAQGPHSAAILLEQASDLQQQGKHAQAMTLLDSIEAFYVNDPLWLYVKGGADVALGRWEDAREEYTRVLDDRPDLPQAYLGRALAAAHLGEPQRVKADLAVAAQIDPKGARDFQAAHGKEIPELLAAVPKESAYDLAVKLIQDAQHGADIHKLVEDARLVQLASNSTRRRADEQYNDGLRRLQNLTAADPKSAQRWADLATYVYLQARVRTVWNGRGNKRQDLRNQNPQQYARERQLAEQYADKALALDANNITAIATKAWLLHMRGQDADSTTLTDRGLKTAPYYPRLAKLKGVLLSQAAAAQWAAANRLRAPKTFSGPGWWAIVYPSQAELQQAQNYENYSQDLMSKATATEKAAYDKYAGTLQGLVALGDYYEWLNDAQQAVAKYEEALKLNPDELQALEGLQRIYAAQNDSDKALQYEVRAISTMQTTAAPWLEVAWELTAQTRWTSARKALDQAMRLDAADARVYGYDATLFSWQNQPGESIPYWKCALALEEARMNLDGRSVLGGDGPLSRQDSLMAEMAAWGLFRDEMATGRQDAAMEDLKLTEALQARTTLTSSRTDLPFMGMPAPRSPGGNVPPSENVPLMMSQAQLLMAKDELARGNLEKAAQDLSAVRKNGYAGNDPQVKSFVDGTSYDLYLKLKQRYRPNELLKFFDGGQLHEFDMRDRGIPPH